MTMMLNISFNRLQHISYGTMKGHRNRKKNELLKVTNYKSTLIYGSDARIIRKKGS